MRLFNNSVNMAISKYWMLWTVCIIVHATQGPTDLLQTELFSIVEKELAELCPKVDICNRNSSEPNVLPNGLIGTGNQISCCQGCSCHERCYENMNCCYPHDEKDTSDEESNLSVMECLYVQTGTPDETWPRKVPAYRIVSSAPKEGCVDNTLSETNKRDGLFPSCYKDPVESLGNLNPVYSKEHDKIYKNAECALCHNTTDVIPWLPELVCNETRSRGKITQHLQFFESNPVMSNCYIAFHFSEPSILANKRCYHELVSTCKLPPHSNTSLAVMYTNLSSTDTRKACEKGLKSPVRIYHMVYRNIYCFICNVGTNSMSHSTSCASVYNYKGALSETFSVLFDAAYFKEMTHDGVSDEKIAFPEACVRNGPTMTSDRCRNILCPSGQIRTRTGCKFPIKFVDSVSLMLRLNCPEGQEDNLFTLVQQGIVKQTDMKERFLEKKPWHSLWTILTIAHNEETHPESMFIEIMGNTKSPAILFRSIKNSIGKQWTVNVNGSSIDFEQSFLEYFISNMDEKRHIFYDVVMNRPRPLSKLFVCDQVSLYSGEFNLTEDNTVLISNLTVRILYDMEFDLVYDVNNTVTVMVCLPDTVFRKQETNGSRKERLAQSMISIVFANLFGHLLKFLI